jgi:hypothetical protein
MNPLDATARLIAEAEAAIEEGRAFLARRAEAKAQEAEELVSLSGAYQAPAATSGQSIFVRFPDATPLAVCRGLTRPRSSHYYVITTNY